MQQKQLQQQQQQCCMCDACVCVASERDERTMTSSHKWKAGRNEVVLCIFIPLIRFWLLLLKNQFKKTTDSLIEIQIHYVNNWIYLPGSNIWPICPSNFCFSSAYNHHNNSNRSHLISKFRNHAKLKHKSYAYLRELKWYLRTRNFII